MAITLAIADSEDGTGGIATVAGSNAASTSTLYRAPWTGDFGQLTWTLAGSRTGDGTIGVAAGVGYYLFRLDNLLAGTTLVVVAYGNFTDVDALGVLKRILDQVKVQIVALGLVDIPAANVEIKWLPRQLTAVTDKVPACIISPAPIAETMPNDLTGTDKVGYPVLVACIDKQNQDYTANIARNTLWREKLSREFRYQSMEGLPEIINCVPEPKAIIDPAWFDKNTYYAAMIFRFISRETRGN